MLAGYSGWGGCADAFSNKPEWADVRERLEELLSEEELAHARSSVLTAYYTPSEVTGAIYDALASLGFGADPSAPDEVLEPGCGVGNFMGVAPSGLRFQGVEVDPLSAEIASALNPESDVVCAPLERCLIPEGSFDAVVGNVPFHGDVKIVHPVHGTLAIHDYFLVRALEALRPGGILACVTSRFTLDKRGESIRRILAQGAEMLAICRLPETAFKAQANTEAVTDVIIMRKRDEPLAEADEPWLHARAIETTTINAYLAEHPELMAGEQVVVSGPYGATITVKAVGQESVGGALTRILRDQLARVPSASLLRGRVGPRAAAPCIAAVPSHAPDSEYVLDGEGRVWFGAGDTAELVAFKKPSDAERLAALVRLRDDVKASLALQGDPSSASHEIDASIASLKRAYESFVALYGRISTKANIGLYERTESAYYLVSGLEILDSKGAFLRPADVFERRVISAAKEMPERAQNESDALAYSLDRTGRVDIALIARLLDCDEAEAVARLGEAVVEDPFTGEVVLAEDYLSGDLAPKRAMLVSEIAAIRDEAEARFIGGWERECGIDGISAPHDERWEEAKALLKEKGAWSLLIDPDNAASFTFLPSLLDANVFRHAKLRSASAVEDIVAACREAHAKLPREQLTQFIPYASDPSAAAGGSSAYLAHLLARYVPDDAETMAAVVDRALAEGAAAALPGRGIESARDTRSVASVLCEEPALSEYLLTCFETYDRGYGSRVSVTYRSATAEGFADFKRQREAYFEKNPLRMDTARLARLEGLLSRVEAAYPQPLSVEDVALTLGSHWIPPRIVYEFAVETFGLPANNRAVMRSFTVTRTDATGAWQVGYAGVGDRVSASAKEAYATRERNCFDILQSALNSGTLTVTRETADGKREKDHEATMAAWDRRRALTARFKEWAFEDPERAAMLARVYNERFNTIAPRTYRGDILTFPDKSALIELTEHQRNAIARCLFSPEGSLIAHVVGAGKTFDGIAATYEARRIGKAKKPLIAVPNHLTEQWAHDYMQLYPKAKILVMNRTDMRDADTVKRFWGRASTGDWDAVIVAQSRFSMLPVSPDRRIKALEERAREFAEAKTRAEDDGATFSVKAIEAAEKMAAKKIADLRKERDSEGVYFDALGFDMLVVDEAHNFKNLAVATSISVAGISVAGSQKCEDLLDKCDFIRESNPSNIVFLTGTPVSNSMSELYNMQRYLAPGLLEAKGVSAFSAWASTFGEIVDSVELKPEGTGFQIKQRFARFHNLPELMAAYHMFADIKTNADIALDLPECEIIPVAIEATEEQRFAVAELADRASAVRAGHVTPDVDNMLKITGDGRKVALDPKLLDVDGDDEPLSGGKVQACAENVARIWRDTAASRGSQLIFCDSSTPASGKWNIYADMRRRLIELGVPDAQIAFVNDANTDKRREALFESVREGAVRILLGSTQKLGTGTNVQTRLVAVHDLDCPWRPSDLEQRMGRIVRRGNLNEHVKAYRYVTVGTFDSYLYQTVQNKQAFISQVFTSDNPARSAADLDETVLSYAEIKALATGDPNIQRRMELENRAGQLKLLKSAHAKQMDSLRINRELVLIPRRDALHERYEAMCADAPRAEAAPEPMVGDRWCGMSIDGVHIADREQACRMIVEAAKSATLNKPVLIGEYRGFEIWGVRQVIYGSGEEHVDKLAIKGEALHVNERPMTVVFKGAGTVISQADALISSIVTKRDEVADKLAQAESDLADVEAALCSPWEHQAEYDALTAEMEAMGAKEKETHRAQTVSAKHHASLTEQIQAAKMDAEHASVPSATEERTREDALCVA